jgi:glycosyltransferase involved in cell wall biosynthesis
MVLQLDTIDAFANGIPPSFAPYHHSMTMKVSFVIPAHNEEQLLPATLRSIRMAAEACGVCYEIIVADDASTDGSAEIAHSFGAHVICVHHRRISATRNSGARNANGDLLVFVDADTAISAEVLRAALDAVAGGAVGGGAVVRFDGVVPFYARVLLPILTIGQRVSRLAAGCFVFCTRAAFDAVGGFDERLFASEEIAFSAAMKKVGRFVIVNESVSTSGRKLRTHSPGEMLLLMARFARGGRAMLESRDQLGLWYGPRRADPIYQRPKSGELTLDR